MNWISVKDKLPKNLEEVLVKTDCKDCPIVGALYLNKFIPYAIIQCDHHYETDQKFHWLKVSDAGETEMYVDRIIEWIPLPKPPKEKM